MNQKPKVFIDTNILLDVMLPREPGCYSASELLNASRAGIIQAIVSTQSILDAAYTVKKSGMDFFSFKNLWSCIRESLLIEAIDWIDLAWAMEHYTGDFEDDAQFASAYNSCCDYFITRDKKLLKMNGDEYPICVMTAEDFVAKMK